MKRTTWLLLFIIMMCTCVLLYVLRPKTSTFSFASQSAQSLLQTGVSMCRINTTTPESMNSCIVNVASDYLLTTCPYLSVTDVPSTDPMYAAWQDFQTSNVLIDETYSNLIFAAGMNVTVAAGPTVTDTTNYKYVPSLVLPSLGQGLGPMYLMFAPPNTTPAIQVGQLVPGDVIPGGPVNVTARVVSIFSYPDLASSSQGLYIMYPPGTQAFSPTPDANAVDGYASLPRGFTFQAGSYDSSFIDTSNVLFASAIDVFPAYMKFISKACPSYLLTADGQGNEGCVYEQWTSTPNSLYSWNQNNVTFQRVLNWSKQTENEYLFRYGPGTTIANTSTGIPVGFRTASGYACSGTFGSNGIQTPPTSWLQ
jgi:hypothetical protein